MDLSKLMEARCSTRALLDPKRPTGKQDLMGILEAARWAPTPRNMQNLEIVVIDD